MSACVLTHSGDERREADIGLLCFWHRNRMTSTSNAIRELWLDLALIIEAGSAPKDETPRTRHLKAAEAPAPANLDALALRDERSSAVPLVDRWVDGEFIQGDYSTPIPSVLTIVASWLLCVADERPLTATLPGSVLGQLDVLVRHHDWIAAQLWVDDYVLEMTDLHKALKLAVHDYTHREVGRCRLPVEDRDRCGGALIAENGSGVITCRACRATWVTPQEQARLAVALESS